MLQSEAQVLRVEADRPEHVGHLVSNAVKARFDAHLHTFLGHDIYSGLLGVGGVRRGKGAVSGSSANARGTDCPRISA
jgi:hypothetical protein